MDEAKRRRLEAAGWKVGTVQEFLQLTDVEAEIVELKLVLSNKFKQVRKSRNLSQKDAANLMDSSQSRVAKLEAGDPSVSFDLLIRGLLFLGVTQSDLAQSFVECEQRRDKEKELAVV